MAVLALYGAAEISRQLPGLQDVMEEAQPQPPAQHLVGGGRLVHLAQRLASGPGDIAIQGEQRVPFRGREVLQVDAPVADVGRRSAEHPSELQPLMRTSYAVFCLNTK